MSWALFVLDAVGSWVELRRPRGGGGLEKRDERDPAVERRCAAVAWRSDPAIGSLSSSKSIVTWLYAGGMTPLSPQTGAFAIG
jgi:hypothetical protein